MTTVYSAKRARCNRGCGRTLAVRCLPADPVCRLVAESRHRRQDSARLPQPTECGERDAHRSRSCSAYSIPRWYPMVTAKTRTSTSENHSAQRIVTSPLRFRVNSPAGHRRAESPAVKHPGGSPRMHQYPAALPLPTGTSPNRHKRFQRQVATEPQKTLDHFQRSCRCSS
jgi:hypothetical protein